MAVKGNLTLDSISVGYRNPYGSTGPSVVVGGNVNVKDGAIYNGPKDSSINTAYSTPLRTRFHTDGGQSSTVIADSIPR